MRCHLQGKVTCRGDFVVGEQMLAPPLHLDVPDGSSGQKAGGMPGAWRESWRVCQALGGGGGDHSCYSEGMGS